MTSPKTITILWCVLSAVGVSAILAPAQAVPVVPNFSQGSMTSHTETTSKVTETINSIDYATGWQYSCLLYTSPSPRDQRGSRMPSSA